MGRRIASWFAAFAGLLGAGSFAQAQTPFELPPPATITGETVTPTTLPNLQNEPTLSDILTKGLRCRRPEEFTFVSSVVAEVESGSLPLDVTLAIFKWSRTKREKFPFFYFQRAMQLKAIDYGVTL